MSISKTERTFVDVARQLFAKNGLEGTTMNDIAVASGKGRRTLYTYFSKKEDIYSAVIESELERLSEKLDEVAARKIRPQDKIIELIYTHLSTIRETVVRNGNLRAEFFRNIWWKKCARSLMPTRLLFSERSMRAEICMGSSTLRMWISWQKSLIIASRVLKYLIYMVVSDKD